MTNFIDALGGTLVSFAFVVGGVVLLAWLFASPRR
jgi:hypothetical protein